MAYIIGILQPEEQQELEARGWEIEPAPKELISDDASEPHLYKMVWVDSSMFEVMNGPDWEKSTGLVEIVGTSEEDLQNAWPNVSYKGKPFFDKFYDCMSKADQNLKENGFNDFQECFVGYIPSKDTFVIGYDAWYNDDDSVEHCLVEVKYKNETIYIHDVIDGNGLFYPRGRKEAKEIYPDIVELRLD